MSVLYISTATSYQQLVAEIALVIKPEEGAWDSSAPDFDFSAFHGQLYHLLCITRTPWISADGNV